MKPMTATATAAAPASAPEAASTYQPPKRARRARRFHPLRRARLFLVRNKAVLGRVLAVLLALAACVVPMVVMNNLFGYLPMLALVFSIAFSLMYLQVLKRSLAFEEDSDFNDCFRGTKSGFTITLINRSILVFTHVDVYYYVSDLFGDTANDGMAVVTLGPRERRDMNLDIVFAHIGTYSVGLQKVVVHDFLGLFSSVIENDEVYRIQVKPRLYDLGDLQVSNEFAQESKRTLSSVINDGMDYAGVREYVMGDAFKTIHWKLSSRNPEGQYYTRLMETYANPGVSVYLDHTAPKYDNETLMGLFDAVVEAALSVSRFCALKGYGTEFVYRARGGEVRRMQEVAVADFQAIIADMPVVQPAGYQPVVEMLAGEQHSLAAKGNMVVCSCNFTDALLSTLVDIKQSHRQPILFAATPPYMEDNERAYLLSRLRRLEANRIPYYLFSAVDEIAQGEVGDYAA